MDQKFNLLESLQDFLVSYKQEIMQEVDCRIAKQAPIQEIQDDWIGKRKVKELLGYSSDTSLQYLRDKNQIVYTYVSARKILYSKDSILKYLKSKKGINYEQFD